MFKKDFEANVGNLPFADIQVYTDEQIPLGENWHEALQTEIHACDFAILLVSDQFMHSKYIKEEEVAKLFTRKEKEGILVVPVYFYSCRFYDWKVLSKNQLFKPLGADYGRADRDPKKRFCYADLVRLDSVNGVRIPQPNPDRGNYMMDFVEKLEPQLKALANSKK
ncbi:TIR domain-containing protein [Catalinimonas alkaloidigena]|uniref:TIR domain-containing protein n=1 Tax=Catalinimonas alkaloidigena TaxID=1075417 RepID=A0A1G9G7J1_9BACT|nr:toll/interleukin-1 receptor domain-containing protein [Catalinimonas alkaloidigena]SDK96659.1 TIR domain-containing protein [Catalinimonas alkaloidigena]